MQQAVNFAKAKRHTALTPNRLRWLEEGKTKHPDADVLLAVAEIYGTNYKDLASDFVTANYGSDLPRHAGTGQQAPHLEGGADVPASARVRELQNRVEELEAYEAIVRQIRPHLASIVTLVGEEGADAAGTKARRRGGDRKTDR